jgi:hypothetical protein
LHLLDTGHFATATHNAEIAELISAFLESHVAARTAAQIPRLTQAARERQRLPGGLTPDSSRRSRKMQLDDRSS